MAESVFFCFGANHRRCLVTLKSLLEAVASGTENIHADR